MVFRDRIEAGRYLATKLAHYAGRPDLLILALPRGGVPVAFEVAKSLEAPLDVFLVRKLGFPGHEEFAMGAIASGGVRVLNEEAFRDYQVPMHLVDAAVQREMVELERREKSYRGSRPHPDLRNKTVVVVD